MYKPANFSVQELVPEHVYDKFGDSALRFVNPLLTLTLQQLRNKFGRLLVNSYNRDRQQSGLRTSKFYEREYGHSESLAEQQISDSYSMHKFGCAADCIPLNTPLDEIKDYIKNNPDEFPFLHFVEEDVNWLHIDVRNQPNITFWSPKRGTVYVAKQKEIDWSLLAEHLG
jgi:hypothetical protein